jgi:hypothetical protein
VHRQFLGQDLHLLDNDTFHGAPNQILLLQASSQAPSPGIATLTETRAELTTDYELLQRERQQVAALSSALGPFCSQRLALPALTGRRTYCSQQDLDLRRGDVDLVNQLDGLAVSIRQVDSQLAKTPHR